MKPTPRKWILLAVKVLLSVAWCQSHLFPAFITFQRPSRATINLAASANGSLAAVFVTTEMIQQADAPAHIYADGMSSSDWSHALGTTLTDIGWDTTGFYITNQRLPWIDHDPPPGTSRLSAMTLPARVISIPYAFLLALAFSPEIKRAIKGMRARTTFPHGGS